MDPEDDRNLQEFMKHQKSLKKQPSQLPQEVLEVQKVENSNLAGLHKSLHALPFSKNPLRASLIERNAALDESTIETRNNRSVKDLPFELKIEICCFLICIDVEMPDDFEKWKNVVWGSAKADLERNLRRSHEMFCLMLPRSGFHKLKTISKNWNFACRHNFLWKKRYSEIRILYSLTDWNRKYGYLRWEKSQEAPLSSVALFDPPESSSPTCFHDAFLVLKKRNFFMSEEQKKDDKLNSKREGLERRYDWYWVLSFLGLILCLVLFSFMLEPKNFDSLDEGPDEWILDPGNPLNWCIGIVFVCFCIILGFVVVWSWVFYGLRNLSDDEMYYSVRGSEYFAKVLGSLVVLLTLVCVYVHGLLKSLHMEVNLLIALLPITVSPVIFLGYPFFVSCCAPTEQRKEIANRILRNKFYYAVLILVLLWISQSLLLGTYIQFLEVEKNKFWTVFWFFIPSFLILLLLFVDALPDDPDVSWIMDSFMRDRMNGFWGVCYICTILLLIGKLSGVVFIFYPWVFLSFYVMLLLFWTGWRPGVGGSFVCCILISIVCAIGCGLYWSSWILFFVLCLIPPCCCGLRECWLGLTNM